MRRCGQVNNAEFWIVRRMSAVACVVMMLLMVMIRERRYHAIPGHWVASWSMHSFGFWAIYWTGHARGCEEIGLLASSVRASTLSSAIMIDTVIPDVTRALIHGVPALLCTSLADGSPMTVPCIGAYCDFRAMTQDRFALFLVPKSALPCLNSVCITSVWCRSELS